MKWILKAVIQKSISFLPASFEINYFFQKHISKRVLISDLFFETMLNHAKEIIEFSENHGFSFKGKSILELGTGWHPIVPIALILNGADSVVSIDLRSLIRKENLQELIQKFLNYHDSNRLVQFVKVSDQRIKLLGSLTDSKLSISDILNALNIQTQVGDFNEMQFNKTFDFTYSVNVLEHVQASITKDLANSFYQVSKKEAFAYHAIGVYDHFVHFDTKLSKFNYLKYSARAWQIIDNSIQPQNRLRISYFEKLFKEKNFAILEKKYEKSLPEELAKIKVHPDYEGIKDIDVPYGTFLLQKESA